MKKITNWYDIDCIIIFSKTAHITQEYNFIDKQYIYKYDESCENKIQKILEYQEKNLKKNIIKNIVIVFDDLTLYKKNIQLMN